MTIEVVQVNDIDISISISPGTEFNIEVATVGVQGPAGASASITEIITYSLIFG